MLTILITLNIEVNPSQSSDMKKKTFIIKKK